MTHFARINENNIVEEVIVAEQDFIDTLPNKEQWIQTSYNTFGGKHAYGKEQLRKNFAGVGFLYDKMRDAFIPPKPEGDVLFNEVTCLWEKPLE
jgi:hypothetical protein